MEISISTGKLQCQFNVALIVHWLQFLGVNVEWWILNSWVVQFFLHGNLGNCGMATRGMVVTGVRVHSSSGMCFKLSCFHNYSWLKRNACLYAFEYAEHLIMLEIGLYGMPDILYLTNSGSSSIVKNMQATALKKKKNAFSGNLVSYCLQRISVYQAYGEDACDQDNFIQSSSHYPSSDLQRHIRRE